jgi:hypothetical protein
MFSPATYRCDAFSGSTNTRANHQPYVACEPPRSLAPAGLVQEEPPLFDVKKFWNEPDALLA